MYAKKSLILTYSFRGSSLDWDRLIDFRSLVKVLVGNSREHVAEQTAHLISRKQKRKAWLQLPKNFPPGPTSLRFHHLPIVPPLRLSL
jgi:hypothetical protein